MTGLITVVERLREKTLQKREYFLIFVVTFALVAFFITWRDQFERAEGLQAKLNEKPTQPTIQVNVPPPTVIFGEPKTTTENRAPKPSPKPKRSRFALTDDHARMAITEITASPPSGLFTFPYFNFFHANLGKSPALGFLRKIAVATTPKELTQAESNQFQLQNSTFVKDALDNLDIDQRKSYPNEPGKKLFSIPGSPTDATVDQISKELDNVKAAKRVLVFFRHNGLPGWAHTARGVRRN